jgi:hypothetical protein
MWAEQDRVPGFVEISVMNGGSSALFTTSSRRPWESSAISSTRFVPPVLTVLMIVRDSTSMTFSVLSPSPA